MEPMTAEQFNSLLKQSRIKPKLQRDLRFVQSTEQIKEGEWGTVDLLAIHDRHATKGVLFFGADTQQICVIPYELHRGITDVATGRTKPIICDLCRTWQGGGNAARITFARATNSLNSVGFLCCADLRCSWHVRTLTQAGLASRAQLHEDLTNAQRAARLRQRMQEIAAQLAITPIHLPTVNS